MDWPNLLTVFASVPVPVIAGIIICFKRADKVKEEMGSEITRLKERIAYLEGMHQLKE